MTWSAASWAVDSRRSAGFVAVAAATGAGIGRFPVAPGTIGSIPGLALAWALWTVAGPWAVVAGAALVTAVGTWAAGRVAMAWGVEDPGAVVVDEIAGQMVALFFLAPTPATLVASFLLFRIFDVWKPWPASRLEKLPGGSGIMADDLAAGAMANLVLQATFWFRPEWGLWLGSA